MAGLLATALLRTQDDERLAALASAGHAGAFDVLVARHERTLRGLARRLAGPDAAEDVTQQALLRAWAALQRGAEVQHPRGWLHRIVRTTAIDHGQQMPDDTTLPEHVPAPADLPAEVQHRLDVRQALALIAELPDEQRAAVLAAAQGRTSADVADELGVSEGAVRQLAYRARAGLRAAMTAVTPYPLAVWAAQRMAGESAAVAAEVVGAGGSVLGGALLAKAGTAVVASGIVVAGIAVPDTPPGAPVRSAAPPAQVAPPPRPAAAPPAAAVVFASAPGPAVAPVSTAAREDRRPAKRAEQRREREREPRRDRDDRPRSGTPGGQGASASRGGGGDDRGRGRKARGAEQAQPGAGARGGDRAAVTPEGDRRGRGERRERPSRAETPPPARQDAKPGGAGERGSRGERTRGKDRSDPPRQRDAPGRHREEDRGPRRHDGDGDDDATAPG